MYGANISGRHRTMKITKVTEDAVATLLDDLLKRSPKVMQIRYRQLLMM